MQSSRATESQKSAFYLVGRPGLEPGTLGLKDASDLVHERSSLINTCLHLHFHRQLTIAMPYFRGR
jgi:hypothetical protein